MIRVRLIIVHNIATVEIDVPRVAPEELRAGRTGPVEIGLARKQWVNSRVTPLIVYDGHEFLDVW